MDLRGDPHPELVVDRLGLDNLVQDLLYVVQTEMAVL